MTRGHNLRLHKFRAKYDLRKYYFTNRVVNIWNSLPSYVISAETVNCFKSRLIISGKIRILFMVISQIFREPETEVK